VPHKARHFSPLRCCRLHCRAQERAQLQAPVGSLRAERGWARSSAPPSTGWRCLTLPHLLLHDNPRHTCPLALLAPLFQWQALPSIVQPTIQCWAQLPSPPGTRSNPMTDPMHCTGSGTSTKHVTLTVWHYRHSTRAVASAALNQSARTVSRDEGRRWRVCALLACLWHVRRRRKRGRCCAGSRHAPGGVQRSAHCGAYPRKQVLVGAQVGVPVVQQTAETHP
jgi:hypothetical protein